MERRRARATSRVGVTPLVVDAGALIAASHHRDRDHHAVREVVERHVGPIVTTQMVLAEADHILMTRGGVAIELAFLADVVAGAYRAEGLSDDELARAVDVVARYRDLEVGLADASLVVLAARYRTRTILTLDERCFRAMTPLTGGTFHLLPADG